MTPWRARLGRLARVARRVLLYGLLLAAAYYAVCALMLLTYRFVDPPTTGVQVQRRIESWLADRPYHKRYSPVSLAQISDHLEHAVIAAEDGRFYEHRGVDWQAVRRAMDDNRRRDRARRGGSTITQQLVKNLFLTTHSAWWRKALEVPHAWLAELLLPKNRILELYLNVIEWGPGVYGVEEAARLHYGRSASLLTREQAAGLAAVIPNPRVYTPQRMPRYRGEILRRMSQMGW